jgi:MATE family multidrug resistance protein
MGYLFKLQPLRVVFAWKGMWQYWKLAIPGLLQICLEWWILEAVSLLCGILPDPKLAIGASYIVLTLESLAVMGWLAVLVFNSVRVGFFVGADNVLSAKRAAQVGILSSLSLSVFLSILVILLRKQIPLIYTSDPEIVQLTSDLLYVLAAVLPVDALNNCMGGIMGGLGLQRKAAICQLIGYYLIGMPLAVILVFVVKAQGKGVFWLWGGVFCSMLSSCCLQAFILFKYDWQDAVADALERIEAEKSSRKISNSSETQALLA